MTDAIDLTTEQRNQLSALLRRFLPGVAVWAYGSRVKWTARPNSDLDLVAFTVPEQRVQVADLKEALAESNLPFPVDLHVWDDVPERFREIICKEYVVVQEDRQQSRQPDMRASYIETRTGGRPATTGVIPGDFALSVGKPDRPAPPGWRWTALSDLARLETGHTPSRRHPEYWGGDVPWIGIKDATENHGRVLTDTFQHTNELGIANSSARILPENTVCLSRTASVGYVVVMGKPMATSQDFVNWVCSDALNHQFLKYVFLAEHSAFLRFASGTTHQTIYFPEVKAFHVCLPSLPEQRAIAHILGTLDDKIELNRKMNETLEAMARALFKAWFVDFDPVRAKRAGRDPGLPKPLADLFPDSFEDSELGEIPKGWGVGTLSDIASLNPESWSKETRPEVINYIDLSNVKWGSIDAVVGYRQQDAPSRAQRVLRSGDTIVGTVRPGNGSYAFINADGLTGSTGFAVLRPHRSEYAQFIYLAATAAENIEALAHLADGGAYPAVRPDVVMVTPVIRPRDKVLARFSLFSDSLLARIAQNERESSTLAALRDTLLPKLVSGELRVKDTEQFMERAF